MNSTIIIIISVVSATTLVGVGLIIAFTIKHKKCKKLNNNVKKTNGVKK
jgi:flagellar basal body-associated protein FliL